ncbi:MAG: transposase, partial [Burkholderiales bacterium]
EGDSQIERKFGGRARNFTGENFWARGYFVSTVGLEENMVRAYIRNQEEEDERYEQMKLGM